MNQKKNRPRPIRVLLLNPPVYDFRFDWARWHQPCGLLRIGSLLSSSGNDVRLIDCLQQLQGDRIQRRKLGTINVDGQKLPRWQYGLTWEQIEKKIESLEEEKWKPDVIHVTCMMTFWWEGARDLIYRLHSWFPKPSVILGGVYPSLCSEHASQHIRGVHFDIAMSKRAKNRATDFDLYDTKPHFAGIFLYRTHSANKILKEIEAKYKLGVREFAFFDDEIPGKDPKYFESVLDLITKGKLNIKFRALGNLSLKGITRNIVVKMKRAGFRQIFLRDDIALIDNLDGDLSTYERGIELLLKFGDYKPRTEDITAMVLVGFPGENLEHTAERLTRLAHVVGSVNLVPYQPTPGTGIYNRHKDYLDKIPLEMQNGKLFPFAKLNHARFSDYQELIRLAALLNSKYRDTTFDFLGDDEIAKMVRKSMAEETWRPKIRETIPLIPNGKEVA